MYRRLRVLPSLSRASSLCGVGLPLGRKVGQDMIDNAQPLPGNLGERAARACWSGIGRDRQESG